MNDFETRMEALRSRFRSRAGDEATRLNVALTSGDRSELARASHALTGNAGLFGFADLSKQAALVEEAIDTGEGDNRIRMLTQTLIAALRAIAE